jgi:hypothetical protein
MEEPPAKGDWLHQNRRPVAVIISIFVVFSAVIVVHNFSNNTDTEYELSYSLTVWIAPLEEEFSMYLDFYISQQNAEEEVDNLQGIGFEVQPSDNEEHNFFLANLPENLLGFWVRICFDSHDNDLFVIFYVDTGQKTTTTLLGREISILIQPFYK